MITKKDIMWHDVFNEGSTIVDGQEIRVISLSLLRELRQQLKDKIEGGEAFGQYLWTQHQTDSVKVNKIITDLIVDVTSQINRHIELIDEVLGVEGEK
jgi:hypothetical protein